MKEWRQGWFSEVRHWPISMRKRLIDRQSAKNQKLRDEMNGGDPYAAGTAPDGME